MRPWWVRIYVLGKTKIEKGCVEAPEIGAAVDVVRRKFPACQIEAIDELPYPAAPRWNFYEHQFVNAKGERTSKERCPSFCYDPEGCKGRTSCPKNPSCVE